MSSASCLVRFTLWKGLSIQTIILTYIYIGKLLPPIDAMKSANSEVIFQQDVSQCHHTTLKVKAWFASNDISLLVLRSSSPDFSPIESFMERDEKKN